MRGKTTWPSRRGVLRLSPIAMIALCALLLAACGSSSNSSSSGAATSPTTSEASEEGGTAPAGEETEAAGEEEGVTDYLEYTKGKAGKADESLSPVTVGFVNNQGGPVSYPLNTSGAEAAVDYVNNYLGGIEGHPLKLSTCFVASTEEEGRECGLQMVNDDSIKAVLYGTFSTGDPAFQAVNKGAKPMLMTSSTGIGDSEAKNAFIYWGSALTSLSGAASYAEKIGAKNAAVIYPSGSATAGAAKGLEGNLKAAGVESKAVAFEPNTKELTAPLVAAGAQTADLVVPILPDTGSCIAAAEAAESLGIDPEKIVTFGSFCFTEEVAEGLGGAAPEWLQSVANALLTSKQPDVSYYKEEAEKVGLSSQEAEQTDTAQGWSIVLTAARFLNEAGGAAATPADVAAAAKSFAGPMLLGSPDIKCGAEPKTPAVCSNVSRVYQHQASGEWVALTGWLAPPGQKASK